MSKKGKQPTAQRFGGEFGPYRKEGTTGVSLGTFKTLVWTSNIGGLVLCVIALELLFVQQEFMWGLISLIAGVLIALFPSNYEIVGMDELSEPSSSKNPDVQQTPQSVLINTSTDVPAED